MHEGNQYRDDNQGPEGFHGYGSGGAGGTPEGLELPPWERRERFGFLNGLYLTIKDVLFTPGPFFKRMPSQVGLLQPLMFTLVLGVVAAFFAWMWSLAGSSLQALVADDYDEMIRGPVASFFVFLTSPVSVTISLFIKAALLHVVLMLVGGNRLGFEATFRVAAYSEAAGILALVPMCGSVVGLVWTLVICVVGLYNIHDTDPWKAVVAVLGPAILCTSLIGASVFLFVLGLD